MLVLAALRASGVFLAGTSSLEVCGKTEFLRAPLCWLLILAMAVPCAATQAQDGGQQAGQNDRALAYFANAADYQNGGAFELAAEEWEKLVKDFPDETQASAAWHHLGICNLRRKEPNRQRAIEAFRNALKDSKMEHREESLINLAWALISQARGRSADVEKQKQELGEARRVLSEFMKSYSDSAYADQAAFYLGEIDQSLGDNRRASEHFRNFLSNKSFAQSPLRPDAVYALAVACGELKQPAEAERWYQEFLDQHSSHSLANEVRLRLSDLLAKSDKAAEAYSLLLKISDKGDTESDSKLLDIALLRRGAIASQLGKLDESADHFQRLLERSPPGSNLAADAAHGLALTWMRQGKYSETSEMLNGIINQISDSGRLVLLRLDLADALLAQADRASEARSMFESIAREHAESPLAARAAYNAAFMALEADQITVAQQWAERFLNRYPNDPLRSDVAFIAAETLLRQGLHAGAAQAFSKLIESDSKNDDVPLWRLRQAMAIFLDGRYAQAAQNMQSLIGQLGDVTQKAEALYISGSSYLYLEQPERAIGDLEASYASDPHWAKADETLLMLGEAHQRSGAPTAAKRTYQRLLQELPSSRLKAQVQYKLAQLTASEGDLASALIQYRSITQDPSASSFHNFSMYGAVWCLMQQGDFQQALAELQPLLNRNLNDSIGSEALLAQGVCLRNLGRSSEAVTALERFLERRPTGMSLANGLYEMSLALTNLDKVQEANAALQRILAEIPNYPGADKVLYELAWNFQEQEQVNQANQQFSLLATKFPGSPLAAEAQYMVAQHDYDAGNYEQAMNGYRAIIETAADPELLEKSLYKLGWCLYQAQRYNEAIKILDRQIEKFPVGALAVDGLFMRAECDFKQDRFEQALEGFRRARTALENHVSQDSVSSQVKTLIYLHGAQCLRELGRWEESSQWLKVIIETQPGSPYLPTAIYELGQCKQNLGKIDEAITHYSEVASNYRSEVAARARFMLGELYFAQKDFVKAIPEFQRVMYGFGGERAPEEIKKWQAKSAFEAARCSEALIQTLNGPAKKKIVETTIEFYQFLVEKHASEIDLTAQAQTRLGELQKLR